MLNEKSTRLSVSMFQLWQLSVPVKMLLMSSEKVEMYLVLSAGDSAENIASAVLGAQHRRV